MPPLRATKAPTKAVKKTPAALKTRTAVGKPTKKVAPAAKAASKRTSAPKKTAAANKKKKATVGKKVATKKSASATKKSKKVSPAKKASATTKKKPTCVVVGSSFMDYVGYCERIPVGGETVHSSSFQKGFGGKGANQAYMVALHAKRHAIIKMVSAVGKDGDGAGYIKNLQKVGVDTKHVSQISGESTGLAMISVSTVTGQNQIVICPNATTKLVKVDMAKILGPETTSRPNDILVVQNEIPLETTLAAIAAAKARGMITVFNPAPAPTPAEVDLIKPFMSSVDIFCPNETEAALLTGIKTGVTQENAKEVCDALLALGVKNVVMTMGSQGYCIANAEKGFSFHPSYKAEKVVDTTGAGDCFVGAMVSALLKQKPLSEACDSANSAACISVQRKGTQTSFPTAAEAAKGPNATQKATL